MPIRNSVCPPLDLSPEAMRRFELRAQEVRQRRAEAFAKLGYHDAVDVLLKVIQNLDFTRTGIDNDLNEMTIFHLGEARQAIIEILGIDKETNDG